MDRVNPGVRTDPFERPWHLISDGKMLRRCDNPTVIRQALGGQGITAPPSP